MEKDPILKDRIDDTNVVIQPETVVSLEQAEVLDGASLEAQRLAAVDKVRKELASDRAESPKDWGRDVARQDARGDQNEKWKRLTPAEQDEIAKARWEREAELDRRFEQKRIEARKRKEQDLEDAKFSSKLRRIFGFDLLSIFKK